MRLHALDINPDCPLAGSAGAPFKWLRKLIDQNEDGTAP
jgi:hypothetical protein